MFFWHRKKGFEAGKINYRVGKMPGGCRNGIGHDPVSVLAGAKYKIRVAGRPVR